MIEFDTKKIKLIHKNDFNPHSGSPIEILLEYGRPICVYVPGRDSSRSRVLSVLIHGNEPTGYFAFLDWLKKDQQPKTDVYCFISGVGAALTKPYFTHRVMLTGQDLNRCFEPPFRGYEGELAEEILQAMKLIKPEALVDIHNTSGNSPDFGISTNRSACEFNLCSMFTTKVLVICFGMGTLVEVAAKTCPSVTIECGNSNHPQATPIALRGLETFFQTQNLEAFQPKHPIHIIDNPIRLELKPEYKIVYSHEKEADADIVMPTDIDKLNSEAISSGTKIAHLNHPSFEMFTFDSMHAHESIEDYFYIENNALYTKVNCHLIMVTTNPIIAQNDCLFYIAKDKQST